MKKWLTMMVEVIILICISVTVLASDTSETANTVIGVSVYNLNDAEVRAFRNYLENYIGITFNVDFIYSTGILSAEDEIAFIEELHEKGVKGIISFLSTDLEQVLPVCEEYGMYYIRGSGTINNEMFEKVKNNPYFLGVIGPSAEEEQKAAEDMAQYFASEDSERKNQYIITSGGAGVNNEMHRLRTAGILNQLQKSYNLSYEKPVEELVLATDTEKIETGTDIQITIVPGYPSVENLNENLRKVLDDGENNVILSVLSVNSFMDAISACEQEKKEDIQVGAIDCFTEENYELFHTKGYDGKENLDYLVGKYGAIVAPAFVAMENAYEGYAEDYRENGSAFQLQQSFWTAISPKEFDSQYALSIGMYDNTYSAQSMMKVMKAYEPSADFDSFKAFTEKL